VIGERGPYDTIEIGKENDQRLIREQTISKGKWRGGKSERGRMEGERERERRRTIMKEK